MVLAAARRRLLSETIPTHRVEHTFGIINLWALHPLAIVWSVCASAAAVCGGSWHFKKLSAPPFNFTSPTKQSLNAFN